MSSVRFGSPKRSEKDSGDADHHSGGRRFLIGMSPGTVIAISPES